MDKRSGIPLMEWTIFFSFFFFSFLRCFSGVGLGAEISRRGGSRRKFTSSISQMHARNVCFVDWRYLRM